MRLYVLGVVVFLFLSVPVAAQADNFINEVFFSAPVNLYNNPPDTLSYIVGVALDTRGNINVVWADHNCWQSFPCTRTRHLLFSHSVDGGATFSTPKDISHQDGKASYGPQIAVDGRGNINVVWYVEGEIFFSRSVDGGATFSPPKVISNDAGGAAEPQLVVDALGNINVVWQTQNWIGWNSNIWFSRSGNAGNSFSEPKALCDDTAICYSPDRRRSEWQR
jgi:hypothetical protein